MITATIKRGVARAGAEVLFWIGDGAWRVFDWLCKVRYREFERLEELPMHMRMLWSAYQMMMCHSNTVQDWGGAKGPWRELTSEELAKYDT